VLLATPKLDKRLPRFLGEDEVVKLVEAPQPTTFAGARDRAILELMYAAGLRLAEVVGLNVGGADLDEKLVRVVGKGNKERVVVIGRRAGSGGAPPPPDGR
jgi:integrase/recombinase XerC